MKTQLTKAELDLLLPKIIQVLKTGKGWEAKEMHHPACAIIAAVESIDGVVKETGDDEKDDSRGGFATNGWQWDWWQKFSYKGKKYTLCGSGFYGGHAFHIADE